MYFLINLWKKFLYLAKKYLKIIVFAFVQFAIIGLKVIAKVKSFCPRIAIQR